MITSISPACSLLNSSTNFLIVSALESTPTQIQGQVRVTFCAATVPKNDDTKRVHSNSTSVLLKTFMLLPPHNRFVHHPGGVPKMLNITIASSITQTPANTSYTCPSPN